VFVSDSHFYLGPIFAGKAGAYLSELYSKCRFHPCLQILEYRLAMTVVINTLAYCNIEIITAVKSFMVKASRNFSPKQVPILAKTLETSLFNSLLFKPNCFENNLSMNIDVKANT
jgi:hypothetical protein